MSNVTEILVSQYNINARVGQKTKCPFCGHHSFSITKDDSLGKCFHPSCLKYITPYKKRHKHKAIIDILERLYLVSKTELLNQQNTQSNAYDYLVNERQLHPIVIAHSMIGIMPASYDIDVEFEPIINEIENKAKDKDSSKKLDDIYSIRQKLREVIYKGAEWLVFYYCDAYHNIISMKLRKPYDKKFMSFKLPDYGTGVFGQDLFSPIAIDKVKHQNEKLIVVEGEFDILQLQSLMARKAEIEGISLENHYINGCAVGSVNSADIETISKISKNPVICYDNDNGAGFELVKKAQQSITVSATTTPDDFKDIDDYIKSFDDDYNGAFKAVKDLFANSQKHFKEIESVKKRVGGIRAGREDDSLRAFEKNDLIGQVIADDMSERGKFYYDQNHIYYFDEIGKILILIHKDSLEFKITLFEYGINASENTFSYILEFLLV
ncbi:MAG: toprim domain-containing protein, partial [candidate division Zixibacteria bacterium]|nr:toprim domain-containing protein [candidate division Zixibacteria bacterium]